MVKRIWWNDSLHVVFSRKIRCMETFMHTPAIVWNLTIVRSLPILFRLGTICTLCACCASVSCTMTSYSTFCRSRFLPCISFRVGLAETRIVNKKYPLLILTDLSFMQSMSCMSWETRYFERAQRQSCKYLRTIHRPAALESAFQISCYILRTAPRSSLHGKGRLSASFSVCWWGRRCRCHWGTSRPIFSSSLRSNGTN